MGRRKLRRFCRLGVAAGEWMNILLPVAVLMEFVQSSTTSQQCSALIVGCLGLAPFVAGTFLLKTWPGNISVLSTLTYCMLSTLTVFTIAKPGVVCSVGVGFFTTFGFQYVVTKLLKSCPRSFTIGEACIVSQGLILFILSCMRSMFFDYCCTPPTNCMDKATLTMQIGLLGVGLICFSLWYFPTLQDVVAFYIVVLTVAVGMVVPTLYLFLHFNPVLWVLQLLFADKYTVALVLYWIVCCALAILALSLQVKAGKRASTSVRKYFHVLVVTVFLPGLILRPCLLYLSTGVILALFIMLEASRVLQIPPLAKVLQDSYSVFVDEKDAGILALTPIYLLVGCSLPIWIHPVVSQDHLLSLISGLLAVGVGDTAASVCGHKYGWHNWIDSKKTKEGTAASIVSQMIVVLILAELGYIGSSWHDYVKCLGAVTISSLVEAKTEQVDNLCLPLITYLLLNAPFHFIWI